MMEQTKVAKLLITIICGVVVAGMNVPINPNAETGASTQNQVIRGNDQRRVRSISTNSSPFVCADGWGSINRTLLCNGRIDCADSSDENSQLCNGTSCMNTFPCLNGKCISLGSSCDGVNDCGDNSDEDHTVCAGAASPQVIKCGNGQVLKGVNITCNGVYNCMDKSDEFNCSRCPGQLMCDKGYRCVKPEAICDRIQDCFDGADESCLIPDNQRCNVGNFICPTGKCVTKDKIMSGNRCWSSHVLTREENLKYCKLPNVLCDNATKCIPPEYRCDGKLDCQDGSDEMSPNKNIMNDPSSKCANGFCVPSLAMCNGANECGDNSDELPGNAQCNYFNAVDCNSFQIIASDRWQCDNRLCIPYNQVNDHRNNCGDFSDEKSSSVFYFTCTNRKKVLRTFLCNGRDDCGDSSDEIDSLCPVSAPRPRCPQYTCPSGKCISYTNICDGYDDCGDLSEEQSCLLTRIQTTTRKTTCWEHTCPSGMCIQYSDVCNYINDCEDNSDETGCSYSLCYGHSCPSGKCILSSAVCDGNYDCEDFSDENDCSSTHDSTHDSTYSSTYTYSYTKVASGVSVPGGVVIFVCGCFGYRRRRMRTIARTTTRTTVATAAVMTTTAVASDLPPSYAQVVEASAPSGGIVNLASISSVSLSK